MDSISKTNITVIVADTGEESGKALVRWIVHLVPDIEETCFKGVAFSELSPQNKGDVVISLDSIRHDDVIITDPNRIVDIIRTKTNSIIPVIVVSVLGKSLPPIKPLERDKAVIVFDFEALAQGIRQVLGLPQ